VSARTLYHLVIYVLVSWLNQVINGLGPMASGEEAQPQGVLFDLPHEA